MQSRGFYALSGAFARIAAAEASLVGALSRITTNEGSITSATSRVTALETKLTNGQEIQDVGTAFAISGSAWNTVATGGSAGGAQNTTNYKILLVIRAGVAANPGQNGHIYLEVAPNNNNNSLPTTGWVTVDYVACRNNQAAGTGGSGSYAGDSGAMVGAGRGLQAFVAKSNWYRLRTFVVANYSAPTFILDGATPGYFQTLF